MECDPTPPLVAGSVSPAQADLEERQQLGERASLRTQDKASASTHHPDAGLPGTGSFGLPAHAKRGEEVVTRWTLLCENLVSAIPVKPDGRCAHQHPRRVTQTSQRTDEQRSGAGSALDENPFAVLAPAVIADTCAGQVDHGISTF